MLYKNRITGEIAVEDWGCTGMQVTGKKTNRLHSENFDDSVARWSVRVCMCVCDRVASDRRENGCRYV